MLSNILFTPIIGIIIVIFVTNTEKIKQITFFTTIVTFIFSIKIFLDFDPTTITYQFVETYTNIGFIQFKFGIDGISLYFIILTTFLTPIVILSSWNSVKDHTKYFFILQLIIELILLMIFTVIDFIMFYISFEAVLIPLFFVIGIWGGNNRIRASFLFFFYTLIGSLFILLSIVVIYNQVGTTDFSIISTINFSFYTQIILFIGFFLSFAIKTPLYPFARWLTVAHVEAPVAGSIVLAGTILKLSTYGFIRIILINFPDATHYFIPIIQTICLVSLIYSSFATIRQTDFKALVAYSSIGHISLITIALFSNSPIGIEGAILLSLAHGLISPAIFILVGGVLYDRTHSRTINYYQGLSVFIPLFSILFFIASISNIGVPLSLNWIGEFISLSGILDNSLFIGILSTSSVLLSACYSIWLYARITGGVWSIYLPTYSDIVRREFFVIFPLIFFAIFFGIFPNFILNNIHLSVLYILYTLFILIITY